MPKTVLRERFAIEVPEGWTERYNLAPAQQLLAARRRDGALEAALLRWGLLPSWAKSPSASYKMINARAETLLEKPSYRGLVGARRCLIPAYGFYEWQVVGGRKQPIRFTLAGGEPFAFAGLWTVWTDQPTGQRIESATVITTRANELVAPVHDRMPMILTPEAEELWLDPDGAGEEAIGVLEPYPARLMLAQPASPAVNSVRNDYRDLIELVAA